MAKIGLYVFGTSILWGQGHNNDKKIHTRIEEWLEKTTGLSVRTRHLAHSGAVLKGPAGGAEPARLHGEVPTSFPSLAKQIRDAPKAKEERVVVLLDGGINDVGVFNIINPLFSAQTLRARTKKACHADLLDVLVRAGKKYPTAEIYVLGYYQILPSRTRIRARELETLLASLGVCEPRDLEGIDFVSRAAGNTQLFWKESTKQIRRAVKDANDVVGATVHFVDSGFLPSEGVFGKRSLLYGIGTADPQADNRLIPCARAIARDRSSVHCFVASVGHPNARGVGRYVSSLKASMTA